MPVTIAAETISEKDGHKINRRISEAFQPWCGFCKVAVPHGFGEPPWLDDIQAARIILRDHIAALHTNRR